jgi:hypothetical protein
MNDPIGDRCLDEIERLHRFFECWLGDAATDPAEFARIEPAWPSDFTLIAPDGAVLDRAAVTGWLRQARGVHADPAAPFRIEIRDAAVRLALHGGFRLCTYDEWQSVRGVESLRRSTALLEARDDAVLWRHLQETWAAAS